MTSTPSVRYGEAWMRLVNATTALAAAWAEFKNAMDEYREVKDG